MKYHTGTKLSLMNNELERENFTPAMFLAPKVLVLVNIAFSEQIP